MKNNMKLIREMKKLTQQEVAEYLNLTRQSYNYYELGKRSPDMETLVKLADLYNVSIDYLLGRSTLENDIASKNNTLFTKINLADDETKSHVEQFLNFLLQQKQEDDKKKIAK